MNPHLTEYITQRLQQGVPIQVIKQELLSAGWDMVTIEKIVSSFQTQTPQFPSQSVTRKKWLLVIPLLFIVAGAGAALMASNNKKQPTPAIVSNTATFDYSPYTAADSGSTKELTNFCGKTIIYSSKWTTANNVNDAGDSCLISFYTYNRSEVADELKQDGRLPTNANFWHDVENRDLKSYPYSLDNIYEIQLLRSRSGLSARSVEEYVKNRDDNAKVYSLQDRDIGDYIDPGKDGFIAQRVIMVYSKDLGSGYKLIINRSESRKEIDMSDIKELNRFISSLDIK